MVTIRISKNSQRILIFQITKHENKHGNIRKYPMQIIAPLNSLVKITLVQHNKFMFKKKAKKKKKLLFT